MPWQVLRGSATAGELSPSPRSRALHGSSRLVRALRRLLQSRLDPNDRRLLRRNADGLCFTPLSTNRHQRMGTRERLLDVAARHPDRLRIELHALATRVMFDATIVRSAWSISKGERLYRAHPGASGSRGEQRVAPCATRGDPGRRRIQHAATVDAVRHRAGAIRCTRLGIAIRVGIARRRPQPAGSLRDRRRQPDGEAMARAGRREFHAR